MKRLYLVCPCETADEDEGSVHPRGDAPLSTRGAERARRLAEALADRPLDLVLTSLSLAAVQSARAVAEGREVPVHASLALNEPPRDESGAAEADEEALVRGLGFLNQFRSFHAHVAVVGPGVLLSALRSSLLDAPRDPVLFADPGRCVILGQEGERADAVWREADSFVA